MKYLFNRPSWRLILFRNFLCLGHGGDRLVRGHPTPRRSWCPVHRPDPWRSTSRRFCLHRRCTHRQRRHLCTRPPATHLNGERSWTSLPTNLAVNGSAALLLSSYTLIRFAPAAGFNGTLGALNLRPLSQPNLPWISAAALYGNQQGFIASWISDNQDDSGQGIYAQRFSADGLPIGPEFRANSTTIDHQGPVALKG